MGLFVPGPSEDIERLVKDTEEAIRNTRRFLDQLHLSQERSRKLIQESLRVLEDKLDRLHRRQDKMESDFGAAEADRDK